MITDHLTDAQLCLLGLSIVSVALAGLILVVIWPLGGRARTDRGGFQ